VLYDEGKWTEMDERMDMALAGHCRNPRVWDPSSSAERQTMGPLLELGKSCKTVNTGNLRGKARVSWIGKIQK
jgi:hypothetical protein